ncbi:hypothetical protein OUZ56_011405 [Daphnia magna]|uniref:Uncharacterized protein n=1 Tax=Daphnia magna TaxID=35525 RepID=A0ABQ9Z096_9CRUS|nr:hypothetical protein OUZ56_011405 [Daphnia magna]
MERNSTTNPCNRYLTQMSFQFDPQQEARLNKLRASHPRSRLVENPVEEQSRTRLYPSPQLPPIVTEVRQLQREEVPIAWQENLP